MKFISERKSENNIYHMESISVGKSENKAFSKKKLFNSKRLRSFILYKYSLFNLPPRRRMNAFIAASHLPLLLPLDHTLYL